MGILSTLLTIGVIIFTGGLVFSFIMFIRESFPGSTQSAGKDFAVNVQGQTGASCSQCGQAIKPEYKYCPACTHRVKDEPSDKAADVPAKDGCTDTDVRDEQKEEVGPENDINATTELIEADVPIQEQQPSSEEVISEYETGLNADKSFSQELDGVTSEIFDNIYKEAESNQYKNETQEEAEEQSPKIHEENVQQNDIGKEFNNRPSSKKRKRK